ncbi:hypothetical protein J4E93_004125 [Alternaria ventricosa]|uniref:uncharacterized protein n=1 Tax=Alternaria ventricosa TaxID=1187951 RepID=UPI0020C4D5DC|nr:uncharacterized protein J4E93_004125 [Alternaria ventricosa]KAI4647715.1 hypothetical protein J4E93_004125 [Alternaria ventricosa]
MQNRNFWGCSMTTLKYAEDRMELTNNTDFIAMIDEGYGAGIMNFTEETGSQYAVVGPTISPSETDWQATSYAISSQCAPIPATACDIQVNSNLTTDLGKSIVPFNCTIARGSPIDFSGSYIGNAFSYMFFDFHKHFLSESGTFGMSEGLQFTPKGQTRSIIPNVTKQESAQMFPTTWRWTASVGLSLNVNSDFLPRDMIGKAWPLDPTYPSYTMVVACNTTDSILVQTRARKIMTRAPVAAVWLLVLANLSFAALEIGLAVMAWMAADQDVHQVRTRLGVPGLAAALFERNSENRIVKSDKELYQENDKDGLPLVLVGVQHTVTGGMAWSLRDNQTGRPCLAHGAKMSTAYISDTTPSISEKTTGAEEVARISDSSGNEAVEHQPISIVPSEPVTQFDAVSPIEQPNHWV